MGAELLEGDLEPTLRYPLAVIVGELADLAEASPETMARRLPVRHGVGARAARRLATALAFTEAAALVLAPIIRATRGWRAACCGRHGYLREAEQWIKRSVRAAGSRVTGKRRRSA